MENSVLTAEQGRRKIIIISAVIALAALVIGIALALILPALRARRVDYFNDDLGRYIDISREAYLNYSLIIDRVPPSDAEIDELIMRKQVKHRELDGLGQYKTEGEFGVGDLVLLRYYAYTDKGAISGGSTLGSELVEYTVGAGFYLMSSAVIGLDSSIVGERMEDYSMSLGTAGTVADGVIVYLSYEMLGADGITTVNSERLDLSNPTVDEKMGAGFSAFLVGRPVGEVIKDTLTTTRDGESVTYYAVKVSATARQPLVAVGSLPFDHYDREIASKNIYFDLYIERYVDYKVPALDDEFISEGLGYSSFLDDYEGDDLVSRYKSYLRTELDADYERRREKLIDDLLWEHLLSAVSVKKLPKNDVNDVYDAYYDEMLYQHESLGQGYSIGEFARMYMGLDASADWQACLVAEAERAITEKLLFFYIIRREGWIPEGEVLDEYYESAVTLYVNAALEASGITRESFDTEDEYNTIVSEVRMGIIADFGEEYFIEVAYSDYGTERLIEVATRARED